MTTDPSNVSEFPTGEGQQDSYLVDQVPPNFVRPPGETAFANATWMHVGPEIQRLVDQVMAFDEFQDIQALDFVTVWRRKTKPMRKDDPIFASVELVAPRVVWEALQREDTGFPRFFLDLHWAHFNDLRNGRTPGDDEAQEGEEAPQGVGAQYVHQEVLQQHVHAALSSLDCTNDIVKRVPPEFSGYSKTVMRYGLYSQPLLVLRRQMSLWGDPDA